MVISEVIGKDEDDNRKRMHILEASHFMDISYLKVNVIAPTKFQAFKNIFSENFKNLSGKGWRWNEIGFHYVFNRIFLCGLCWTINNEFISMPTPHLTGFYQTIGIS